MHPPRLLISSLVARALGESPHDQERGIDAVIFLAGGLLPSPLELLLGHGALDIKARDGRTLLRRWLDLLGAHPPQARPARCIVACSTSMPRAAVAEARRGEIPVEIARDLTDSRGPAGALRDLSEHFPARATLLVIEASRWPACDLATLVREHHRRSAAVTVGRNPDGTPAGVYAIRRHALDLVPTLGYMDLKEQWLPAVVRQEEIVLTCNLPAPGCPPLRTIEQLRAADR